MSGERRYGGGGAGDDADGTPGADVDGQYADASGYGERDLDDRWYGPAGKERPAPPDRFGSTEPSERVSVARDRVLLLMILAGAFLFLSFALNWEIDHGSFEVMDRSEVLSGLGTVEASLIALAVAAVVVILPQARKLFPFEFTGWHTVLTAAGVLILLAVITWDLRVFVNVLVQTFVLVFFSAPLLFGLFGVIYHRPVHLVISAMFSFFIAGGVRNPEGDLPYLILFGLFFMLFLETAETSIRCWGFLEERKLSEEHLAGFVDHYFRNLAIFMTASVVLTVLILNLRQVVGALGLGAVAASVELGSAYGQAAAALVVLGSIALLRFLHDRGYTAPWTARLMALYGRLRRRRVPEPEPERIE
jgi:hypothetical protein